jgi:hypothetical protein
LDLWAGTGNIAGKKWVIFVCFVAVFVKEGRGMSSEGRELFDCVSSS